MLITTALSLSTLGLAVVVVLQSRQITNLANLLDRMDIALAKQHAVIDNQQALIDDVTRSTYGEMPHPEKE